MIEKGKLLDADKATADILVKQGKASFEPVEKTKENGGVVPPVTPPVETEKEPSGEPEKDKGGKGNGKGK